MGARPSRVRRVPRGLAAEAPARPILHKESIALVRSGDPVEDRLRRDPHARPLSERNRGPQVTIAVIPVAGIGTRLRPHTHTVPKALIPVAGKPILGHILDQVIGAGVDDVVLVVGYLGEKIESWVRENYRIRARFVRQEQALGNGHAIYVAREHLGDQPVLIILGDTIFRGDFRAILGSDDSLIGIRAVDDPRRFGVVNVDANGLVRKFVEKPSVPESNLAIVGVYYLTNGALLRRCLERLVDENHASLGEYWLVDALQFYVDAGERVRTFPGEEWYDCGTAQALLDANRALLNVLQPPFGEVPGSLIHPPVAIAPSAVIEASIIGPHVAIADGARIIGSVIRDSIINRNAIVEHAVLHGSLIGENALLEGRATRVNLGDDSEIVVGA
ncbi:MAG: nucleotidyl transferase [Armatimonadetes bacterium]|nr:nucleotidyl transferase [Armatimonadota bacterium]